jgi:hypothetical protein
MFRMQANCCNSHRTVFLFLLLALLPGAHRAGAQAVVASASVRSSAVDEDSGIPKPLRRGLSIASATNIAHDSLSGWSTLESPALSFRFNRYFTADLSVPYYLYINSVRTTKKDVTKLTGYRSVLGDTALAGHAEVRPLGFDDTVTVAVTAPTGDLQLGLSTGHVSYDVSNHLEHDLGIFTPDLELGVGDTSGLFRQQIRKNYISSGTLAFFQAGTSVDLPGGLNFDAEAYEQLPLGNQTVYSQTVRKNGTVLKQASSAEDNGVSAELNATVMRHIILGASFNRSIRLSDSTEGVSVAFLFPLSKSE